MGYIIEWSVRDDSTCLRCSGYLILVWDDREIERMGMI